MTLIQRNPFRLAVVLSLAILVLIDVPGHGATRATAVGLEGRLAAGPAATHPVHRSNGMIAFVGIDGATHLDVISPNGSGFRQLVLCYQRGASCNVTSLAWSPDGRRLAFVNFEPNESLDVINADGSGAKRLASCVRCFDFFPALSWSPDGSRIVFSRAGSLQIVTVDSGRTVRLTTCHDPNPLLPTVKAGCFDWSPAWSPDGSMNGDGTHQRRLFHTPCCTSSVGSATLSPDGTRITFTGGELTTGRNTNSRGGIDLMDADGRHLHRLIVAATPPQDIPGIPTVAWQPRPGEPPRAWGPGVRKTRHLRQLAFVSTDLQGPAWQPMAAKSSSLWAYETIARPSPS